MGPVIEKEEIAQLALYNVRKYFTKPIKIDVFFESIGKILKISFPIDTTPCILETHVNNNIIFIEIAQGLNREKLEILKYKLSEIISGNNMTAPKIILMMTDLSLSFVDGFNLELLLDNVTADPRVKKTNVKILTLDSFTKNLIQGHEQYREMEVIENLALAINSLVREPETENITELITDNILTSTNEDIQGSVQMRFHSESGVRESENSGSDKLCIAIVDDDSVVRTILTKAFAAINAQTEIFDSGTNFLVAANQKKYDLIILDILMPGLSGFDILKTLKNRNYKAPVLVYSTASHREAVVQALSLGAKSFLIKPLKPQLVVKKAVEILNAPDAGNS